MDIFPLIELPVNNRGSAFLLMWVGVAVFATLPLFFIFMSWVAYVSRTTKSEIKMWRVAALISFLIAGLFLILGSHVWLLIIIILIAFCVWVLQAKVEV